MSRTLVVRLDNLGDVLLAGPAVAALADIGPVDVLCSRVGRPAAELLPGVDEVHVFEAPWIRTPAPAVDPAALGRLVDVVARRRYDAAAILCSSHQSPLPTALLLRLAGVPRLAAVSHEYAGSLLDHRIPGDPDVHEVRRALLVAGALGADDHDRPLRIDAGTAVVPVPGRVVVHPGASAPARTLSPRTWAAAVDALVRDGVEVIVTGRTDERPLCEAVARPAGADVRIFGRTDLRPFADVIASASAVACGNTGPMHLAAALGRPVAAAFAPTVPLERWAPWMVPHVVLGDQTVACAGCRARTCPHEFQHCFGHVAAYDVVEAVEHCMSLVSTSREVAV